MEDYQGFTPESSEEKLDKPDIVAEQEKTFAGPELKQEFISVKDHRAKMKRTVLASFLVACLLMVGFVLGLQFSGILEIDNKQVVTQQLLTSGSPVGLIDNGAENPVVSLVERYGDAVVSIETESQVTSPWSRQDEMFWWFFGQPFPDTNRKVQGLGSGFIISKDGYVLTNNHVISGASTVIVRVQGRKETFTARVIGTDAQLDLAVLKIDSETDYPVVPLGDSSKIQVGDWAVAIGNPYGLDHTVTLGVISAKGRPLTINGQQFTDLLQTDASINPGNSGGPLLNLKGEVIGINTAVSTEGQGLGFAIPINTAKEVLEQLINKGKVSRPWLGVSVSDITEELAAYLQTDITEGAIIRQVVANSPAQKAGLRAGDIILGIDGQKVSGAEDVTTIISKSAVGKKIEIKILRNGRERTVTATLGEK